MIPEKLAAQLVLLLMRATEPERIATLQAMQRLIQTELARLWAERNDSPGHVLREEPEKIRE